MGAMKDRAHMTDLETFVIANNIARYRKLLQDEKRPENCAVLARLLHNEVEKLAARERVKTTKRTKFSMT